MKMLDDIVDEMTGFVCDELCHSRQVAQSEKELSEICKKCYLNKFITDVKAYEQTMYEKQKTLERKIWHIADNYGYDSQSCQMQEEAAELIQAINKLRRAQGEGQSCKISEHEAKHNLIEELADVEVMIRQLVYLLDCNVVFQEFIEDKVSRTLLRMGSDELK